MKDTALYEHLLALKTPLSVKKVDISLANQRVVAEVVLKKGQVWADPTVATRRVHVNGLTERQWRHLDTCQFETLIKARVSQLKYSDGTVEELAVPWAERCSRVTTLMTGFVIKLLEVCPTNQGVCKLTRLSWCTVTFTLNGYRPGKLPSYPGSPHWAARSTSSSRCPCRRGSMRRWRASGGSFRAKAENA
jgi:transposase